MGYQNRNLKVEFFRQVSPFQFKSVKGVSYLTGWASTSFGFTGAKMDFMLGVQGEEVFCLDLIDRPRTRKNSKISSHEFG